MGTPIRGQAECLSCVLISYSAIWTKCCVWQWFEIVNLYVVRYVILWFSGVFGGYLGLEAGRLID